MPYKINYEKDLDYIAITIEGDFSLSPLKELAVDVDRSIDRYKCNRILNDMRPANLSKGAIDIYNMPKAARRAGIEIACKRALVVREQSTDFHFLETVFLNQGHNVKMFTDINEAMHWLLD